MKELETEKVTHYETLTKAIQLGNVNANRRRGRPRNLFKKIASKIPAKKEVHRIDNIKAALKRGDFPTDLGFELPKDRRNKNG